MANEKRILILINKKTGPNDKNWSFFQDTVSKSIGVETDITMGEIVGLTFELDANGSRIYDRERGFSLDDFDLVVFRFIRKEWARAAACASFLKSKNIPYIDSQIQPAPWSKYSAQALRQDYDIAGIPSVYSNAQELKYMIQNELIPFNYPLIIKDNNGKKGRLNFFAHNKVEALKIFEENPDVDFIIQKFIENDGDYRFLVFGGQIAMIIYRKAKPGSHLNNTSQGSSATLANVSDFKENVLNDVKLAARLQGLDIAGVDLMIDKTTSQHYIIEVNSSPQLASGAFPDIKIKLYTDYLKSLL